MHLLVLWLLAGCGGSAEDAFPGAADRAGFVEALAALPDDPETAMTRCTALHAALRGDCVVATVEAAPEHPDALAWCDALPAGQKKDECHFQRAERLGSLEDCGRAGAYEDDCRLHVWGRELQREWPDALPLQEAVDRTRARMEEHGIDTDDLRYWSAAFRRALSGRRSGMGLDRRGLPAGEGLDRSACATLSDAQLAEACRRTGISVFHDRINRTRDFGNVDCAAGELPDALRHGDDAELRAILVERWKDEICPGSEPPT